MLPLAHNGSMDQALHIHFDDALHLRIRGVITRDNAMELVQRVCGHSLPVGAELELDFSEAWIADGLAMLMVVNTLRSLATRVSRVRISQPPEPLRKTLQQAGALDEYPALGACRI